MNLGIESQIFVITGASSGLGRAVAEKMAEEGARLLLVARRTDLLEGLAVKFPERITIVGGDVRTEETQDKIVEFSSSQGIQGIFINAGGPPARRISETTIEDWDEAYALLVRWKVRLAGKLLPTMEQNGYGRLLFSESSSVKQPVDNLVLSNSMRLAIAGFSKTLSAEYAHAGITSNLIAPGYHDTEAVKRLFTKKSQIQSISFEQAREQTVSSIPVGKMGNPSDFATLACWLLSPLSGFVTGQVFCLDGGNIRSTL